MEFEIEEVEFDEELYKKNLEENQFVEPDELDGKGEDQEEKKEGEENAIN